jgi:hypothetical protein
MIRRAIPILLLLLFGLLHAPPASAQPAEKTVEEKIALLLSAHHRLPPRSVFEAHIPEAKQMLISLALRQELFRPHRHRAIEALSMWPDDEVRQVYLALLDDPRTPVLTKHRILLLVPQVFGAETPTILEPWRTHPDPRLRETALTALRRSRSPVVR